ncbi:MAG: hypothetical protein ACRC1W_13470 [Shewanella sp.]
MAKLTMKAIMAAIIGKTGIKPEYLEMARARDGFYFEGKVGAVFAGGWVDVPTLNAMSLDQWVAVFESMLAEWQADSNEADINAYIESINWAVVYE